MPIKYTQSDPRTAEERAADEQILKRYSYKPYTGVGSRETPAEIQSLMTAIAQRLAGLGFMLRSGGADGADTAFELGAGDAKEIFLPWRGFNNNPSPLFDPPKAAFERAQSIHPAWFVLKFGGKKLHARNIQQVLGQDLTSPSRFLICWTPMALEGGGTRTAIITAHQTNITVFNLANRDHQRGWSNWIDRDNPIEGFSESEKRFLAQEGLIRDGQ